MSMDSLITVENLYRYYGELCAVHDLCFEVRRGEVLGFLGPNGAGKSTTMRMIGGSLAPSAGRVLINGIDILDEPMLAKAELGYLPETPPLYRDLTVDEYLLYCARINRISRAKQQAAIDSAKERCGLTEVGRRLIANLSKGYQQRVGIAQAIIHSPLVVLLDEPTVGLDPIQIREIRSLIRDVANEHSVVLSTHILPEVQSVCDRVQIINRGRLVLNESIEQMREKLQATTLLVALRVMPSMGELESIEGVQHAEVTEDGRVRIRFDAGDDPSDMIVEQAVANGWGLHELTPERMTLEQVFVDITSSDAHAQGESSNEVGNEVRSEGEAA
jgi:ABC-2 type transport system ATP-binding protein